MQKRISTILTLSVLGLLTACGGGGGGGDSDPTREVGDAGSTRALSIYSGKTSAGAISTETQGDQAAGAATNISDKNNSSEMFRIAGDASPGRNLFQLAFDAVRSQTQERVVARRMVSAKTQDFSNVGCSGGSGTMSGTVSMASDSRYSAGDYAVVSFTDCVTASGLVLDGQVAYVFNSVTGDFPYGSNYSVRIGYAASNARVLMDDGMTWARMNGAYTLALSSTSGGDQAVGVSGDTLAIETYDSYDGSTWLHRDVLLQDFRQDAEWGWATDITSTIAGKVSTYTLGVSYTVNTPTPIKRAQADRYPHTGVVVATGANGRKVRVTALDNTNVELQYDLDGDGTYELTRTKLWTDLPVPERP